MAQIPSSIKNVAEKVESVVRDSYPDVMCLDDLPEPYQKRLLEDCGKHELFHIDMERFIGDVYQELTNGKF